MCQKLKGLKVFEQAGARFYAIGSKYLSRFSGWERRKKRGVHFFPVFDAMLLKLNLEKMSISSLSTMLMKTSKL